MARTLAHLAKEALDCQDASNLSSLVLSWAQSVQELRKLLGNPSTDEVNWHPINKLWASKVHSLTNMGMSDIGAYAQADYECRQLVAG